MFFKLVINFTNSFIKFVKPGDVVFYTIASENTIPFFRQGFVTVAENRIMAIVNENLTERKENYGRKSVF